MAFAATIAAQLAGVTVRCAPLVHFDFVSGPSRLWPGFGTLVGGGHEWTGLGDLGSISASSLGPGLTVEEKTYTLAAGPEILDRFASDAEEATGREVNEYLQFFDENWATLDQPWQTFWGIMGPLKAERPETGDPMQGGATRSISVTVANAFVNRARPANSFFSHRDQQARHPGDNIFSRVAQMAGARVRWPYFS